MENLLMDFHLNRQPAHRLLDAITDFCCGMIRRGAKELHTDGVWVTDDLGTQGGPMFGLETFREFFRPCYTRMIQTAHDCGMHFWLHSCGNIEIFLQDFIDIGLDVVHPLQKYTMDERRIAQRFGGKICFWAGMDCQQILPRGSEQDVRREVRFMIDNYDRPDGGCMMALGNVASSDVPVENLKAMFDESYNYGQTHRRR
jgi:uroporphyrinogen-III decarboxylase